MSHITCYSSWLKYGCWPMTYDFLFKSEISDFLIGKFEIGHIGVYNRINYEQLPCAHQQENDE